MKAWREECAVFGIWGDEEAGRMTYLGLYAQQHRGQEATGIVNLQTDGSHYVHKGFGLVGEVFTEEHLEKMRGPAAIGHVRYSTTGENQLSNIQPLTANLNTGPVGLAHNGNIVNAEILKKQLKLEGAIFQGTNDTECLLHLLARHPSQNPTICLHDTLPQLEGAYSMVMLTSKRLIACRDPWGFRPLVLGRRPQSDGSEAVVIASETCAFDLIGARYEREIAPGELFWVDEQGEHSEQFATAKNPTAFCVFEHVYFSRPDSLVFGESVYEARKKMGQKLATEKPVDADIVIPVPDSGVPAAIGYSMQSGIPFELGIIRNHYIGRTFIQPSQSIRSFGVKIKLNPQAAILKGKRVVVIDDSLVRGTTSQKIIGLVRQAGATEVHFRIASPPTTGACYYGVDTPRREQLIASTKTVEEIREFINADSLSYLSVEGMMESVGGKKTGFCAACFNGEYPTSLF
ncbi:MAG: amidophosphoribosyltransferase [Bdellovibrionales bacterium]|nr:amidophosphoribosyltransferase [Bdellovibrionales bacterium]